MLFELDRRPFEAALAEAEGKLRQARAGHAAGHVRRARGASRRGARRRRTSRTPKSNLRAHEQLVQAELHVEAGADDAQARVERRARGGSQPRRRASKRRAPRSTTTGGTTPAVRVAQAEVEKARLDLEHAVMRAPEDGWVTRFDLTPGTVVTPGNPLFAIVVGHSFWVDANFKETELAGVVPGRPATIVVDMYPKHTFHGTGREPGRRHRRRVLAAAGAERERQLGEGRAARSGQGQRRRSRSGLSAARRRDRDGQPFRSRISAPMTGRRTQRDGSRAVPHAGGDGRHRRSRCSTRRSSTSRCRTWRASCRRRPTRSAGC